jgi:hypothetical protein
VALTGAATNAAITAADGSYSFNGLPNGSYTVTPVKNGYRFIPTSGSITVNNANILGVSFGSAITSLARWYDQGDGTIYDATTDLFWLQNAFCNTAAFNWGNAQTWAAGLKHGDCGLSDNSAAGDWRVPTKDELIVLTTGMERVSTGTPRLFSNVQSFYWSSSTYNTYVSWAVSLSDGHVFSELKNYTYVVLPVRAGK